MATTITIPDDIADEVRRFAAFIIADRPSGSHDASVIAGIHDGSDDYPLWADDDVLALANAGTTTARNYRAIMDAVIAEAMVGQWVSLDDLASWTGVTRSGLSTFRTHLYRYVHSHLSETSAAPFTGRWGTELRPARGREVYYRVSAACADQWVRVRPRLTETSR